MKNTSLCFLLSILFFTYLSHSQAYANKNEHPLIVANFDNFHEKAQERIVAIGKDRDELVAYLGGKNGLLLCFHGTNGGAAGWVNDSEKMNYLIEFKNNGYSFICPTSQGSKWLETDFEKVNKLLDDLHIDKDLPLILVGHSNGGAFATRYALLKNAIAVHLVNSRGIEGLLSGPDWKYKTFLTYARCDKIVDYKKVEASYLGIKSQKKAFLTDKIYEHKKDNDCHHFLNTAKFYLNFLNSNP